mgnify:CR=1 FL=1
MITRETDYALRLLRTLRDGERRTAAEAAERELVPQSFAHKNSQKACQGRICGRVAPRRRRWAVACRQSSTGSLSTT